VAGRPQYQDYPLGPLRQPLPRVTRRRPTALVPKRLRHLRGSGHVARTGRTVLESSQVHQAAQPVSSGSACAAAGQGSGCRAAQLNWATACRAPPSPNSRTTSANTSVPPSSQSCCGPWTLRPPLCYTHRHIGTRSKYCRAGRQRVGQRLNGFQVLVTVPGESRWQTTSRPMPAILRHCAARISELTTQKQRLMEALVSGRPRGGSGPNARRDPWSTGRHRQLTDAAG